MHVGGHKLIHILQDLLIPTQQFACKLLPNILKCTIYRKSNTIHIAQYNMSNRYIERILLTHVAYLFSQHLARFTIKKEKVF